MEVDCKDFEIIEKWKFATHFLNIHGYELKKTWNMHLDIRLSKYPYKYTILYKTEVIRDVFSMDELFGYVSALEDVAIGKHLKLTED